jgi:hypothetical protein
MFYFYSQDQHVIVFPIQVDVLMLRLVFQDHYLDGEVSRTEKKIFLRNSKIKIPHSLQFYVMHQM